MGARGRLAASLVGALLAAFPLDTRAQDSTQVDSLTADSAVVDSAAVDSTAHDSLPPTLLPVDSMAGDSVLADSTSTDSSAVDTVAVAQDTMPPPVPPADSGAVDAVAPPADTLPQAPDSTPVTTVPTVAGDTAGAVPIPVSPGDTTVAAPDEGQGIRTAWLLLAVVTAAAGTSLIPLGRRLRRERARSLDATRPDVALTNGHRLEMGNAQDVGARDEQQDAFGFTDPKDEALVTRRGILAVVADGMGGMEGGRTAGTAAVATFIQEYCRIVDGESVPDALERALQAANAHVLALAEERDAVERMGCTLVGAVIHDGTLQWISVGDSRIYLRRGPYLTQLTVDHSYGAVLEQQYANGEISLRRVETDPHRNALTSFVGIRELTDVDRSVTPLPLEPDDWVVLCSDGVYGALADSEIAAQLTGGVGDACHRIAQAVLAEQIERQDNLTVAAVRFEQV